MSRWARGEGEIAELVTTGQLQQVTGGQADGTPLSQSDPSSSPVLRALT